MKDKRKAIMETALKLFTTEGFQETPTSRIAKEAGIATGTLFHYFSTKEELINRLYLECKDSLINAMTGGIDENADFTAAIRSIWQNIINWGTNNSLEFLFFQQFSNSPYITKLTKEEGLGKFAFLNDMIEDAKKRQLIKNVPAGLIIEITSGIVFIIINSLLKNRNLINDKKYLDDAFGMLLDSIKNFD